MKKSRLSKDSVLFCISRVQKESHICGIVQSTVSRAMVYNGSRTTALGGNRHAS